MDVDTRLCVPVQEYRNQSIFARSYSLLYGMPNGIPGARPRKHRCVRAIIRLATETFPARRLRMHRWQPALARPRLLRECVPQRNRTIPDFVVGTRHGLTTKQLQTGEYPKATQQSYCSSTNG
jgi:hypothetical protein